MSKDLRIGMIGLDTSHVTAFTSLLNDPTHPDHIPGGKVVVAYPGGSEDFELSVSRVREYTNILKNKYGVHLVGSPELVAENSDAILLESVDGRVHLEQFKRIAAYQKPVFIDKPLATSLHEAKEIFSLAKKFDVPLMSCSSLRFADSLTAAMSRNKEKEIFGADCYGPMSLEATQPGLFWYGIHMVEMLYTILGPGCQEVTAIVNEQHEVITGVWTDGRIGCMRGNRLGNRLFGAVIHYTDDSTHVDIQTSTTSFYASQLDKIMQMFKSQKSSIDDEHTLEIIQFIEAANESRNTGKPVTI